MKIAVLASHTPESIRKCGQIGSRSSRWEVSSGAPEHVRVFFQFGLIFDKDGRGVESEPSSASATPMDVDGVGKGKGYGCFVCGHPGHAAKDCKFNQGQGQGPEQMKEQRVPRLTRKQSRQV